MRRLGVRRTVRHATQAEPERHEQAAGGREHTEVRAGERKAVAAVGGDRAVGVATAATAVALSSPATTLFDPPYPSVLDWANAAAGTRSATKHVTTKIFFIFIIRTRYPFVV